MPYTDYYLKTSCRICKSRSLQSVISLTPTPPGNAFVTKEEIDANEAVYPLDLFFCNDCCHIQLGHVVDPKILYQRNYSYVTSTSPVFVKHFESFCDQMANAFKLDSSSFVIDIGSNDGTCLSFFQNKNMKVLGVDPATHIAESASASGIPTIPNFFSSKLASEIVQEYGYADLITSHNVCAHIDDLDDVMSGVQSILKRDGIFVMEVGYFLDVYSNKWFDTIYHEHLDYHTVTPLPRLFDRFDMEIIKVERIEPQGGSIRVIVQNAGGPYPVEHSVSSLINIEKSLGLQKPGTLIRFQSDIDKIGKQLWKIIKEIKNQKKTIAAYGAPTKATTLAYHFGIENGDIEYIIDENPLKQGLYLPGKHIPVLGSKVLYEDLPDFVLILAWNFADAIIQNHQDYLSRGGHFIVPLPNPTII